MFIIVKYYLLQKSKINKIIAFTREHCDASGKDVVCLDETERDNPLRLHLIIIIWIHLDKDFPAPRRRTTTYELRVRACVCVIVLHFTNYILMILISRSAGKPQITCSILPWEIVSVTFVLKLKLLSSLYAVNAIGTAVGAKCEIVTSVS